MADPTPAAPAAPAAPAVIPAAPAAPVAPAAVIPPTPAPATAAVVPPVTSPVTPAAPAAPAAYVLKMPEGSILDTKAVERTTTLATSLGLSPDHAQKALEFASAEVAAYRQSLDANAKQIREKDWPAALMADPEVGGSNLSQTMLDASAARKVGFSPAFDTMLNETGLGNHPEMVKFAAKFGRMLRGDTSFVPGNGTHAQATPKSAAQILYGDTAAQVAVPSTQVG